MNRNKPKPQVPDEEGSPAWMTTYADMITLVLTFFVLLFSFSTIDALKWKEIVSSLSGTPFVTIQALDPGGTIPAAIEVDDDVVAATPVPTKSPEEEARNVEIKDKFNQLYAKIKNHIEDNNLQYILNVESQEDAILIRMSDSALFDDGKDNIKPDSEIILLEICEILQEYESLIRRIRVEGHTDNNPIRSAKFRSNWHLASSRADNIVLYFIKVMDIAPAKLEGASKGEYHPIASNETAEGRAKNRRVDFIIESIIKE